MPLKLKLKKFIVLLLVLSLSGHASAPAFAQTDSEQVAEEMAKAAAHGAIHHLGQEGVKILIDEALKSPPPAAGEATQGAKAIAWINAFFAAKNFFDAKNDEQRFMATLDAGVAGLTIAMPPAGAIAAAALLAVKVAIAVISVGHMRKMMELAEQMQRDYEAIIVVRRQLLKGEVTRVLFWTKSMRTEIEAINAIRKGLEKSCLAIKADTPVAEMENCQRLAQAMFPHVQAFLNYSRQMMDLRTEIWPRELIFESMKTTEEKFRSDTENLQKALDAARADGEKLFAAVGTMIAKAAVNQAVAEGTLDPVRRLRNECFDSAQAFNRHANLLLVRHAISPSLENRAAIASLLAEEGGGFEAGCEQLTPSAEDPLYQTLHTRRQTLAAAEAVLYAPFENSERN